MKPLASCLTLARKTLQGADAACLLWAAAFVLATGASAQMTEVARLQAGDVKAFDWFGASVSLDGDRALVGSPSPEVGVGAAYVFEPDGSGTWTQAAKLQSSSRDTYFGSPVTLSDHRAIVGGTVGACVFERNTGGTWTEVGILDAGGRGGSLSGDTAVLGAPSEDDYRGAIYVYERDGGGTWTMAARLQASRIDRSVFGSPIAIEGGRMIVGATGEDNYTGAAYVFERDETGAWNEVARLAGETRGSYENFGSGVAIRGDRALVGQIAPHRGYVYERDDVGTWEQVAVLRPSVVWGGFSAGLALDDDRAFVGGAIVGGDGAVYVFDRDDSGTWTEVGTLLPGHVEEGNRFGVSVAISGARAIIGAASPSYGTAVSPGEAFIFESVPVGTDARDETPSAFALLQNYPNPFNPTTAISYNLPHPADVTLTVYDLLGRQIKELASGARPAGTNELSFDASGLPSGVYFFRLEAGDYVDTKRMVVVK